MFETSSRTEISKKNIQIRLQSTLTITQRMFAEIGSARELTRKIRSAKYDLKAQHFQKGILERMHHSESKSFANKLDYGWNASSPCSSLISC